MTDKLKRYFCGEMNPSEELEFQHWLAAHSEDPELIGAMSAIFDEAVESSLYSLEKRLGINSQPGAHTPQRSFQSQVENPLQSSRPESQNPLESTRPESQNPSQLSRKRIKLFRLSTIVSIACACIGIALLFSYRIGRNAAAVEFLSGLEKATAEAEAARSVVWSEFKVANGDVDTLLLSDGSVLYLNSGSRVTYPSAFEGEERRIFVDGEIYADIAKDPSRPFFVQSGDVTLKVLGTTFNYKAYGESHCVETLLLEGSVQMDISSPFGSRQILMNPGNIVQFDRRDGNVEIRDFQPSLYKSFRDSRALHFYNITLEDIAADLERVFETKVVVMDEKLAHTRIFAIFTNNETLPQILSAMNRDRKMEIKWRDGVVYLASSK